ncbi:hypothetical protein ACF1BQ_013465 [Bradyrhizobium sp. RDT10]
MELRRHQFVSDDGKAHSSPYIGRQSICYAMNWKCGRRGPKISPELLRQNADFLRQIKLIWVVQPSLQKYSA